MTPVRVREELRKSRLSRAAGQPTSDRIRREVETETGELLPPTFFSRAYGSAPSPVRIDVSKSATRAVEAALARGELQKRAAGPALEDELRTAVAAQAGRVRARAPG